MEEDEDEEDEESLRFLGSAITSVVCGSPLGPVTVIVLFERDGVQSARVC